MPLGGRVDLAVKWNEPKARQDPEHLRRLGQLFREEVGMTPKRYCRLRRFQSVVRQIARGGPVDWADVALAGG